MSNCSDNEANPEITGITKFRGPRFMRIRSIPGEVTTTLAETKTLAEFKMENDTCVQFDYIASYKSVGGSKAGAFKGSVCYRMDGGVVTIVGDPVYPDPQTTTAGDDCEFDLDDITVRVRCTAIDADDRNWGCELRAQILGETR